MYIDYYMNYAIIYAFIRSRKDQKGGKMPSPANLPRNRNPNLAGRWLID